MSQIDIRNAEGEVARTIELADSVFGIEPNIPVIHQVVVCQAASMRQGTHSVSDEAWVGVELPGGVEAAVHLQFLAADCQFVAEDGLFKVVLVADFLCP